MKACNLGKRIPACKVSKRLFNPMVWLSYLSSGERPEARKDFNLPKKIKFHDVTLRDGEQQAGLIFTKDQKIALADKMAELERMLK